MDLLPETFEREEQLLRAVLPADRRPDYWKGNRLSSAVFKDKKGLSVERTYDRSLEASVQFMRGHLSGNIASVTVGDCESTDAVVVYLPSLHNKMDSTDALPKAPSSVLDEQETSAWQCSPS